MKRLQMICTNILWLSVVALLVLTSLAHAQSGGGYDLTWNTTDSGGATFAAGGGYELGGTIGQPDAGVLLGHATGVTYTLSGGFWAGVGRIPTPPEYNTFLPIVIRNAS